MEVFTLAALAAIVVKATSVLKLLRNRQLGDVITQLVAWGIGIAVAVLAVEADAMGAIDIAGQSLSSLDSASTALLGLSLSSTASVVYDFRKAIDSTDTAREPSLIS